MWFKESSTLGDVPKIIFLTLLETSNILGVLYLFEFPTCEGFLSQHNVHEIPHRIFHIIVHSLHLCVSIGYSYAMIKYKFVMPLWKFVYKIIAVLRFTFRCGSKGMKNKFSSLNWRLVVWVMWWLVLVKSYRKEDTLWKLFYLNMTAWIMSLFMT